MRLKSIVPVYCPACQQLTFVFKNNPANFVLVDITPSAWNPHSCSYTKPETIKTDPALEKFGESDDSYPESLFRWEKSSPNSRKRKGDIGVITKIKPAGTGKAELEMVTTSNELITIKPLFDATHLSLGTALDIKDRTRIGKGRFRLKHQKEILPPEGISDQVQIPSEYYQILLTSIDQEKLEVFIDRVLDFLNQNRVLSLSVIPLPLSTDRGFAYHQRQINFIPTTELMRKFSQLSVPDHIALSIKQKKHCST